MLHHTILRRLLSRIPNFDRTIRMSSMCRAPSKRRVTALELTQGTSVSSVVHCARVAHTLNIITVDIGTDGRACTGSRSHATVGTLSVIEVASDAACQRAWIVCDEKRARVDAMLSQGVRDAHVWIVTV